MEKPKAEAEQCRKRDNVKWETKKITDGICTMKVHHMVVGEDARIFVTSQDLDTKSKHVIKHTNISEVNIQT